MQLRTSDYAACANTKPSCVRYFDEMGLLSPAGRNPQSKYRSYDLRQVPHMYLLKTLTEMGFSLRQLSEFGQARTPEKALKLYRACEEQLDSEIARLLARKDMFHSYVSLIEEGQAMRPGEITVCALPGRAICLSPIEAWGSQYETLRSAHGEIRQNGNGSCPLGYAYDDFARLLDFPDHPSRLVSYDPKGTDLRPAGDYLVGTASCGYGETNGLPERMYEYAWQNDLELTGPAYTVYLLDAASVTEPEGYLLQVTVGIKSAAAG